jgi:hypothetical protein
MHINIYRVSNLVIPSRYSNPYQAREGSNDKMMQPHLQS